MTPSDTEVMDRSEAPTSTTYVYGFGEGRADGNAGMRDLLGGKGAGLAEMTNAGVPVPPGFTITTDVCRWYYAHGRTLPPEFEAQQAEALALLEKRMGKTLGDPTDPLGRPTRGHNFADDLSKMVPGKIDEQRARKILQELRRRLSDRSRSQLELDYIKRLLKGD